MEITRLMVMTVGGLGLSLGQESFVTGELNPSSELALILHNFKYHDTLISIEMQQRRSLERSIPYAKVDLPCSAPQNWDHLLKHAKADHKPPPQ